MSVPGVVESTLDGEDVAAEVPLGGEDTLYITPTRTLIYRAEGLLSDETVEEYPHDAERLTVKEGRRKTRFSLEYPIEGTKEFTLPSNSAEDALHPVLAGIMNAGGVTDPGETVVKTYRFSELTLIVTSERLVKHVGEVVWDEDYEEFHYADVTGLTFEEGSVATQIVLEVDGRQQRIKAPKEHAREVRERLTQALCNYYDVASMEDLLAAVAPDEEVDDGEDEATGVAFGEGVDPLDANPPAPDDEELATDPDDGTSSADPAATAGGAGASAASPSGAAADSAGEQSADAAGGRANERAADATAEAGAGGAGQQSNAGAGTTATERAERNEAGAESQRATADEEPASEPEFDFEEAGFEPADSADADTADPADHEVDDVAAELAELREVVEQQSERLDKQRRAIERLVEELSRGR